MPRAMPLLRPTPAPTPATAVIWEYRTGLGAPVLATRTRQQGARPRLGGIVQAGGARWCVYDWIIGTGHVTVLVERLPG